MHEILHGLLSEHITHIAPEHIERPIPPEFPNHVCKILETRNPAYPRHFSNATHVFIHCRVPNIIQRDADGDDEFCSAATQILSSAAFAPSGRICIHGLPATLALLLIHSGACPVASIQQVYVLRKCSGLPSAALNREHSADVKVEDGCSYFRSRFPAKANLASYETTRTLTVEGVEVGYIQYLSRAQSTPHGTPAVTHTLISGLEVREEHRGKGYARLLCDYVLAHSDACGETWVLASVDNFEAVALYLRIGFKVQNLLWDVDFSVSALKSLFHSERG